MLESGIPEDKLIQGFQTYIRTYHLEASVPRILWYLDFFAKQRVQDNSLTLITAHPVAEDVVNEIKTFIQAESTAPVDVQIDEGLIGGFITRYKHVEHDASLSTQLSRLQHSIIHNQS